MNNEIKTQWVAALRSGEYKQTGGGLKAVTPDGAAYHCCLGVLCDLHAKATGGVWEKFDGECQKYLGTPSFLPAEVVKWAGLAHCNPRVAIDGADSEITQITLSGMNDRGIPFSEIADTIEAKL